MLGPRGCSSRGESPWAPCPCGGHAGPQHPLPRHPPTHYSRRAHSSRTRCSTRTAPPCRGFPAPTHPGNQCRSPIRAAPGYFQVPRCRTRCSAPLPGRASLFKPLLQTLPHHTAARSSGRQQPATALQEGLRTPKRGSPILTHTPLPPRSHLPGEKETVAWHRRDPVGSMSAVNWGGGAAAPRHVPPPSPPVPTEAASPTPRGGEWWRLPARHRLLPAATASPWVRCGDTQGTAPGAHPG